MRIQKYPLYFLAMAVLAAIAFSFGVDLPKRHAGGFKSDESTYFAITQSLAYDQDLKYEIQDLQRIFSRFIVGPMGVFLRKQENGAIVYAKSFAYPIWAAPFFRLFDTNGLLLFNSLMLILIIWMAYLMLRLNNPGTFSLGFALVFILTSVAPVYLWWLTADLFNLFITFCGLFFFFYPLKRPIWQGLTGFFFAFAVLSKPSSALPLAIVVLLLLFKKEYKRFVVVCLFGLFTLAALVSFASLQLGDINFMAGERKSFHREYPLQKPGINFDSAQHSVKMSADDFWERYYFSPRLLASNLFYFFFGRFSGLFIYFFFAVMALILFFFRKKSKQEWALFTAIAVAILFFISITPNYFGGSGTVGNRYFLTIYPLFFFLVYQISLKPKHLLIPTAFGILFILPILMDGMFMSSIPRYPAINGFARFFPPEKTLYQSLPTNENHRAFGQWFGTHPNRYQIFFLNDNFRDIHKEEGMFWTQPFPEHRMEAFLVTPRPVKTWQMLLKNSPLANRVMVKIDDHKTILNLIASEERSLSLNPAYPPLEVDLKYIYHLVVTCSADYVPYLADINNEDRSHRGVGIRLTFKD